MSQYNLEGTGKPKIIFQSGASWLLPEPNGPSREGLRIYDFNENVASRYKSEGNKEITVGKKEVFNAVLFWKSISKTHLSKLLYAQSQSSFDFILNEDEPTIKFKCRCRVKFRFASGLVNNPMGYSVTLELIGVEYLPISAIGSSNLGWGTSWGTQSGNQSP